MTSRRTFLHASVAVAAAGTLGGVVASPRFTVKAPAAEQRTPLALHAVVVDQRFNESVEFGSQLALLGAQIYSMHGDVTDVWYSRLYPLWKTGGVAVAGLTGSGVLFCLERLAWDHKLRVVYRGSHQRIAVNRVAHAVLGGTDWSTFGQASEDQGGRWPAAVAASISDLKSPCRAVPAGGALVPRCITALGGRGQAADSTLFSWVIAPPARA
jgi:hypothetical protein